MKTQRKKEEFDFWYWVQHRISTMHNIESLLQVSVDKFVETL